MIKYIVLIVLIILTVISIGFAVSSTSCGFHFGNNCFNVWSLISISIAFFSIVLALVIILKTFNLKQSVNTYGSESLTQNNTDIG